MAGSLILGEVTFNDFEVPENLSIGGKQNLVIHSLPGGGRVVDAMGADEAPIRWSGVFSGSQAAERVRVLQRIQRSGLQQLLTWDAWRYTVVVENFKAELTNSWWMPYQIQLCVVTAERSVSADWFVSAAAPSLTVGLLTATALDTAIGVVGVSLASPDVVQAIGAAGSLAQLVTARAYGMVTS